MFGRTVLEILTHLSRHRVRTLLAIVGLAVGVFALALIGSVGETFTKVVTQEEDAQSRAIRVTPLHWDQPLTPTTRRALRQVPGVAGTTSRLFGSLTTREEREEAGFELVNEYLWAVDSDIPGLEYDTSTLLNELLTGRRPLAGATNEALLDFDLAEARGWDVGDTITIQGRPFVVVGILARPPLGGQKNAYIDYDSLRAILRLPPDLVGSLNVIPAPGQDPSELATRIEEQLPYLRTETPEQRSAESRQGLVLFEALTSASAGLAILAGALMIVNTMLMNVRERHHEIGLKKALGASDSDIVLEFLLEAGILGALGGAIGLLLALFLVLGANTFTRAEYGLSLLTLTPRLTAGAFSLSTLLGALAGAYPAWRAARLDPVRALRGAPAMAGAGWLGQALPSPEQRWGWRSLLHFARHRARWLLTATGISSGLLILTVALSLAEFLNHYTQSATEATRDRLGLYPRGPSHVSYGTVVRELERMAGVRGVVVSASGGQLFESGEDTFGLFNRAPTLQGLDSPTEETDFGTAFRAEIERGQFLAPGSLDQVILGPGLADALGLDVGGVLTIRNRDFTVAGIWEAPPPSSLADYDFRAYITMDALRLVSGGPPSFPQLTVLVAPGTDPEALAAHIREEMPEWNVETSLEAARQIREIMAIFLLVLAAYVSLGLLVGGLSVMNTMFMAVFQRTREIGLTKAVGASDGDVLAEVVEESGWLGMLGGVLGVLGGWLLTVAANTFTMRLEGIRLFMVTPRLIVAALVFTIFLGMLAGLYPGWRAARLDPVRALRTN